MNFVVFVPDLDMLMMLQMVRLLDGMLKITYDLWQPSLSGLDMAQCYGTGELTYTNLMSPLLT